MNSCNFIGYVANDPYVTYSNDGKNTCFASYRLAVRSIRKNRDGDYKTNWINVKAIGKGGEFAERYIHKGMHMAVSGSLETDSYRDRNGQTVYTWVIQAVHQEFCEKKSASEDNKIDREDAPSGFMAIPDEDLPFN